MVFEWFRLFEYGIANAAQKHLFVHISGRCDCPWIGLFSFIVFRFGNIIDVISKIECLLFEKNKSLVISSRFVYFGWFHFWIVITMCAHIFISENQRKIDNLKNLSRSKQINKHGKWLFVKIAVDGNPTTNRQSDRRVIETDGHAWPTHKTVEREGQWGYFEHLDIRYAVEEQKLF